MRSTILICLLLLFAGKTEVLAQGGVNISAMGTPSNPSAILDVMSTEKGFRMPVLSAEQMATLASNLSDLQKGMQVADSATGAIFFWTGTAWQSVGKYQGKTPLLVSETNSISVNAGTAPGDLITWDGNNWISTQPAVQHFNIAIDNRQPIIALNYCIALYGIFPSRNTPFMGELELYSFGYAPKGYALCNGQILPINQYQALFSLLGTLYGGNGINNFALPDLRGRVPVHHGQGPGLSDGFIGEKGGAETIYLAH